MIKNFILSALLFSSTLSYGELFLEITKGSEDQFKVAMIPFEGNTRVSKQLNNIMRSDLIRTGEFSILDEELFCLLYTSPSPRDGLLSRMPSSA